MAEDKEWIKELKAGDKVFVDYFSKYSSTQTGVVQKICDGKIYVDDHTYFIDGVKRSYCGTYELRKWSNEEQVEMDKQHLCDVRIVKLDNVRWGHLKPKLVDAVYGMLNEAGVFE